MQLNTNKRDRFIEIYNLPNQIPEDHINYLYKLKNEGFEPKVIYDIGSSVKHWTNCAKKIWPNAQYYLFEANNELEFLYIRDSENNINDKYFFGLLSDKDNEKKKYYYNDEFIGGNSYYKENNDVYYPEDKYLIKKTITINTLVKQLNLSLPDLVKLDVQGAELDIYNGGEDVFKHSKHMIMELQHTDYNKDAPKNTEVIKILNDKGWICVAPLFCNNGADGDYDFILKNKIIQ